MSEQSASPTPMSGESPRPPVLLLVAHGTRDPRGQAGVQAIVDAAASRRPEVEVEIAYVDVQQPTLRHTVATLTAAGRQTVAVPLLLSRGFHVDGDVARAVARTPLARSAGPLGPDAVLAEVLLDRAREADAGPADALVVAVAGSSDPAASTDAGRILSLVAQHWRGPVSLGFGAKTTPKVGEAVHAAREAHPGRRVVIAPYLIARGFFHGRLASAGADLVAEPLGSHPSLIDLIWRRYDATGNC